MMTIATMDESARSESVDGEQKQAREKQEQAQEKQDQSREKQVQSQEDQQKRQQQHYAGIRRRFIRRAQVLAIIGLTLAWMVELGGESASIYDRGRRRDFVAESMLWDLQNGGTAIGVFPSSRAAIVTRWTDVIYGDQQKWTNEDQLRELNWIVLMTFTCGAAFLFFTRKGKACLENYIENGLPG